MQEYNVANVLHNPEHNKINTNRVIYVQFCTNCDSHLFTIKHNEQKYLNHYENLKKSLLESGIVVKKKPVPKDLFRKSPYCPPNVFYKQIGQIVYFPEIGSFEVYNDQVKIFSKLQSKKWPTASFIIEALKYTLNDVQTQNKSSFESEMNDQNQTKKEVSTDKVIEKNITRYRYLVRKPPLQTSRYSLEKRNLLSMRENRKNAVSSQRTSNRSSFSKIAQDNKQMEIVKMYNSKAHDQKLQEKKNQMNEIISIKNTKANVYLEPLFPKTKFNLQNHNKHKVILSQRIHKEKVSYLASKAYKEKQDHFQLIQRRNIKAKLNKNVSMLSNIKEVTEQQEQKAKVINEVTHQQKSNEASNQIEMFMINGMVIKQQENKRQSEQKVESNKQTIKSKKTNENLKAKEQKSLKKIYYEQNNQDEIASNLKDSAKEQPKTNKKKQQSNKPLQEKKQLISNNNYELQFQQPQPQIINNTKDIKIQ